MYVYVYYTVETDGRSCDKARYDGDDEMVPQKGRWKNKTNISLVYSKSR